MKTKFISISLILIGLSSISCRHSEEILIEQEDQLSFQSDDAMASKDSTSVGFETNDPPKDPPRDGTHWKSSSDDKDTIKVSPKSFVGVNLDSPTSTTIIDNGPKDPPRDGTHWRTAGK